MSLDRKTGNLDEVVHPVTRRALVFVLILTVSSTFLFSLGAARWFAGHPPHGLAWLLQGKWHVVETQKQPVDWIILGDSSAAFSIARDAFLAGMGGSALNLATHGDTLVVTDAWLLGTYLERFPPPKGVVLVRGVVGWTKKGDKAKMIRTPLEYGFWGRLEPHLVVGLREKRAYLMNRFLPLVIDPRSAREFFHPRLSNPQDSIYHPDGFLQYTQARPVTMGSSATRVRNQLRAAEPRISPLNLRALHAIDKMAKTNGFRVFVGIGPQLKDLYESVEGARAYFRALNGQLDVLQQRSATFVHILSEPALFEANEMQDPNHVVYPANQRFSKLLVSEIRRLSSETPNR